MLTLQSKVAPLGRGRWGFYIREGVDVWRLVFQFEAASPEAAKDEARRTLSHLGAMVEVQARA